MNEHSAIRELADWLNVGGPGAAEPPGGLAQRIFTPTSGMQGEILKECEAPSRPIRKTAERQH
ncbi:hypothetical protein [Streptomyces sp. NBC_00154]|uniref:hypothetical protein n=1 Tax=Streptomyces sp. NBC_00154 TaxID=2975670 RepID=UPI0022518D4D|nr:hypothetical protein [Streptomyces sp. NBC_00154]MCX5315977.1 hypothetical protein [Streptomyces sp. NBC_00154]